MTAYARHGRLRRAPVAVAVSKFVAAAVAVSLVSAGSIAAIAAWDLNRQVQTVRLQNEGTLGNIPEIGAIPGGVNLLLIGSDSRANSVYDYGPDPQSELNDVNILLHISADHTSAVAVSFPRDTEVPIPACQDGEGGTNGPVSAQKLNTALGYGGGSEKAGLGCAVATVENLTGLTIPFAAMISFDGVIEMSNAVGGVPVCVAKDIEDTKTELFLPAGKYDLQGMDALKFLRTRYGVGDGSDLTRISSQQVFLSSLVRKVKSSDTLSDVSKLYGLAGAAVRNMTFSSSLGNVDTMVQIAKALAPIDLSKIVFVQYPTIEDGNRLYPNQESATALFKAIAADQPLTLTTDTTGLRTGSVVAPGTETAAPTPPETAAPETPAPGAPTSGATPAPTPTDPSVAVLPPDVLGQTAAQETCSVGRKLVDQ